MSAWGSVGFEGKDTKELDLTLGYTTGGFSISVTDYWFDGGSGYFHYGSDNTNHTLKHKSDMTSVFWLSIGIQILPDMMV